jgi:hypothetical protein
MSTQTPAPVKKITKPKPTFGQTLSSLALYLVELVVPALAAVGLGAWLFTYYNLWALGAILSQVLFYLGVTLVAIMLCIVLDSFTAGERTRQGTLGGGPRARLVKLAMGGLIIPIALTVAVNIVSLPAGGTVLNTVIGLVKTAPATTPLDAVARATSETSDPGVRLSGIEVLSKSKSPQALDLLMRMAAEDRAALRDAAAANALAQALAAYGTEARDPLLSLFNSLDPVEASGALPDDLYGRYFSAPFAGLEAEVQSTAPEQVAQVEAARSQLEAALQSIHSQSAADSAGDPRPLFILQTFQAMNLKSDPDLLALAVKTAEDPRYSTAVRGEALLLVGKLGADAQLTGLYALLDSEDPFIQTRALQAVSAILSKAAK